ncbi:hypothetical protein B0I35DRAFT_414148 [Stachybotrys elegans]|uniref:BTB domain-containing protein n=1 Tax=Stachybotrys elegans TaxID=80388 RepID=A0A8K0SDZ6_9HYPO|nr:hypothetical protein B0I35DRAFT_414148 [Stachybotrys elegans]
MAEPSIIYLDPEADATLQIGKDEAREFHVSSKTLALASPYFAALFGPNFKEGIATRSGEKPCIALEDDDPGAMDTILKALHHQCADIPLEMELKELVQIAIHCDKYDCIKAMKPWTGNWCRFPQAGADSPQKMEDIGLALLAACLLRSANFETMTVHATKHLAGDFASIWANHDQLARIPEKLKATLVGGGNSHNGLLIIHASYLLQDENRRISHH